MLFLICFIKATSSTTTTITSTTVERRTARDQSIGATQWTKARDGSIVICHYGWIQNIGCSIRALSTRERSLPQKAVTRVRTGMLNTPIRTTELQPVLGTDMALAMAVSEIIITVETQNVTAVGKTYGATLQIQQ